MQLDDNDATPDKLPTDVEMGVSVEECHIEGKNNYFTAMNCLVSK